MTTQREADALRERHAGGHYCIAPDGWSPDGHDCDTIRALDYGERLLQREHRDHVAAVEMYSREKRYAAEQRKVAKGLAAALREMVKRHASHSGSCCTFGEVGQVIVTTESCKCEPMHKDARAALAAYTETEDRDRE